MNKVSIAIVAVCFAASHLAAQPAGAREGGRNIEVRKNLDGSVCFPAPYYLYCDHDAYNYYILDLYRLPGFYAVWNGMQANDPPQPGHTSQPPEPLPPPSPPVTPVLHEYHWPEQVTTSAALSIVTTSGTVYLAIMVWVEGDSVHFNSPDGSVHQIPLSSISNSLTQRANAQKNLDVRLPWTHTLRASVTTAD
jgi:hypothetical protein